MLHYVTSTRSVLKRKSESTGGLPRSVTVALNHQYDLISNVAVEDGLMNGAQCCVKLIQLQENNVTFPAIIWVQFEERQIGAVHRQTYSYLYRTSPVDKEWTPIFAHQRKFLVKDVWVTRVQFPLQQAPARTIHVAQSATFQDIYIDLETRTSPPKHFWHHMHYVALSRATSLSGLHIRNLNSHNIRVSPKVLKYMKEARDKYKLQLSYVPLYTFSDNKLKVIYNNVRSYKRHYNDVKNNYDILSADVVVVAETWLSSKDKTENYSIQGYNAYRMDQQSTAHSHHGLIVYA